MRTIGVIGTGLLGSSAGMRARSQGRHVIGFDAQADAAEEALRTGALDEIVSLEEIDRRAEAIVIAAHVGGTIAHLERMRETRPRAQLVIDVSSVKAPIARAARDLERFVGTHPMAGSERSGPSAARADLFDGKTWFYVPSGDGALDKRAAEFIAGFGASPRAVGADEHDRRVALTSHLPQVLALLFAQHAESCEEFLGPAARELLRLSRSSKAMWSDILRSNHANVERELRAFASGLTRACGEAGGLFDQGVVALCGERHLEAQMEDDGRK